MDGMGIRDYITISLGSPKDHWLNGFSVKDYGFVINNSRGLFFQWSLASRDNFSFNLRTVVYFCWSKDEDPSMWEGLTFLRVESKQIPPWIRGFCEPLSPSNDEFFTNLVINLFIGTEVKPFTEIVETSPNVCSKENLNYNIRVYPLPAIWHYQTYQTLLLIISYFKFHLSLKCQKIFRFRICKIANKNTDSILWTSTFHEWIPLNLKLCYILKRELGPIDWDTSAIATPTIFWSIVSMLLAFSKQWFRKQIVLLHKYSNWINHRFYFGLCHSPNCWWFRNPAN